MTSMIESGLRILLVGFILSLVGTNVWAQDSLSTDYQRLGNSIKKEYFSVGALLQTRGTYQYERTAGHNGFAVGNARLQVYGELDETFGYKLQADFLKSPTVLDANMYYNFSPQLSLKAGLFKSPFSYEYLTSSASIDFVNRSTAVNQLAPKRQIGFQIGGKAAKGILHFQAGVFNGNGLGSNQNNDNHFLYAGRLETHFNFTSAGDNEIIFGINASYQNREQAASTATVRSMFQGKQTIMGSDLKIVKGELMLSGEFIYSQMNPDIGPSSNPFGYHATAAYFWAPKTQLLVRWDRFDGDNLTTDSESVIAGLNVFPSSFSKIQLNYIIPTNSNIKFSQLLLNLQINI